ncbi:MAG: hypothetical protein F6J98_04760 [Moorea sp. SIO4G2]|uniref:hypothetical protein n=1 Tax=Moorena sp. SIO3I6 TaxID=2607831 RepID=UPI0013FC3641|nr:hypothetical protein [Moorena sp. SIO3I6]NEO59755.1 hypothetical protein [Moorena sp. SIO4G2]NEP23724.1 hypothetical protein [Moorena sp. SIO3I6]
MLSGRTETEFDGHSVRSKNGKPLSCTALLPFVIHSWHRLQAFSWPIMPPVPGFVLVPIKGQFYLSALESLFVIFLRNPKTTIQVSLQTKENLKGSEGMNLGKEKTLPAY